ncbi:hypothetical protein D3C78_690430 [compost metagenome]
MAVLLQQFKVQSLLLQRSHSQPGGQGLLLADRPGNRRGSSQVGVEDRCGQVFKGFFLLRVAQVESTYVFAASQKVLDGRLRDPFQYRPFNQPQRSQ